MTADGRDERVIEIDLHPKPTAEARPSWRSVPVVIALLLGVLIGMGIVDLRKSPAPSAPTVSMHTVVVTEDGRSETYTMPAGSVVTTPAVRSSCSITVDGRFVDYLSAVVGNAECGATVR